MSKLAPRRSSPRSCPRPPRRWPVVAVLMAAACCGLCCSKLKFLTKEFPPGASQPVVIEDIVLHQYKDGLENQRLEADEARYLEKSGHLDATGVRAYFYDGKDPNCQTRVLRCKEAKIYMVDDTSTSPPLYRKGDIEFRGDVTFLGRVPEFRMRTQRARYSDVERTMSSKRLVKMLLFRKQSVVEDEIKKGFTFDLDTNTYKGRGTGKMRMVGLDDAKSTRSLFLAELAAIPWSCGPDDTPPPPPAREE